MLYVNYSWSRTFGKVQDFKDKQRLSLTNVDEDYFGFPFVVVLFIKHPPRIGGGLYSSIIFHSVCHSVIPSIVPDIILPDIMVTRWFPVLHGIWDFIFTWDMSFENCWIISFFTGVRTFSIHWILYINMKETFYLNQFWLREKPCIIYGDLSCW